MALEAAGTLFGRGTTPAENATGTAALADLADENHVLTAYAADLGVTLDDPGAYGGTDPLTVDAAALLGFGAAGFTIGRCRRGLAFHGARRGAGVRSARMVAWRTRVSAASPARKLLDKSIPSNALIPRQAAGRAAAPG